MDYDAIASHFLTPSAAPIPAPPVPLTAARRLRDALEPIATIGWWSRPAADALGALGHGFFDGYVWGRAAALGPDVAPDVVVSAFGVFERSMLAAVCVQGRSVSSQQAILAARESGAAAGLRACLPEAEGSVLQRISTPLLHALGELDCTARPLFAALRSLAVPADPFGAAWRAAELVREHRGDGHLAACVSAGLDPAEMNVLTETWLRFPVGAYSASRGFAPDRIERAAAGLRARGWLDGDGGITETGRAARDSIEEMTDRSQQPLIASLGDRIDDVIAAATTVSDAVLAAHAAPSDPRKRAAG